MKDRSRSHLQNALTDVEHAIVDIKEDVIEQLQAMDYEIHFSANHAIKELTMLSNVHKSLRRLVSSSMSRS